MSTFPARMGTEMAVRADLPEYAIRNQAVWTTANKRFTADVARKTWLQAEITWGTWDVP